MRGAVADCRAGSGAFVKDANDVAMGTAFAPLLADSLAVMLRVWSEAVSAGSFPAGKRRGGS